MIRQNIYETKIDEEDIAYVLTNNTNKNHPNCIVFAQDFGIDEIKKKNNILVIDTNISEKELDKIKNKLDFIIDEIKKENKIEDTEVLAIECKEKINELQTNLFAIKIEKTFYLMKKNDFDVMFAYVLYPLNSDKYHVYYYLKENNKYNNIIEYRQMIDEINKTLNN